MGPWQLSVSALAQPDKINQLPLRWVRGSRAVMAFTVFVFLSSILSVITAARVVVWSCGWAGWRRFRYLKETL